MVERVNITSNRILLRGSDNKITFDTGRNYIKQDPSGTLKAGGYATTPSVYGYTSANIFDHQNGGNWVFNFVETPDATLGEVQTNYYILSQYELRVQRGTNYIKFDPASASAYASYPKFYHPSSTFWVYNKYRFGSGSVSSTTAGFWFTFRWVLVVTPSDGVTWPDKLYPEFISGAPSIPLTSFDSSVDCRFFLPFGTLDRNTWGIDSSGQSYVSVYGGSPRERLGVSQAYLGVRTFGIMTITDPINLSAVVTV
jgi:hypothetical protein